MYYDVNKNSVVDILELLCNQQHASKGSDSHISLISY